MSEYTQFYVGLFTTMQQSAKRWEPNGSNWHDHLCRCPGCLPDDPDPTDEEIMAMARENAQRIMKEITRTHTAERPFCDDPQCPCHHTVEDEQQNAHYWRLIVEPMKAGLLTAEEANRIFFGEQL